MAVIKITPDLLNSKASEVRRLKSTHDDTMSKLRTLVLTLDENWKGEAQDKFVSKFESMQSSFTNFSNLLESYAQMMDSTANEMRNADQELKTLVKSVK